MGILVSPHADGDRGRERARQFIALYLSAMPNIAKETGERVTPSATRSTRRDCRPRPGWSRTRSSTGPPPQAPRTNAARLVAYRAAGVQTVVMTPVTGSMAAVIDLL
jgi:hypothetical protein